MRSQIHHCVLSVFFGFFISFQMLGQSEPDLDVVPPSPTAASLAKYVTNPISPYTGAAKMDIPILQLNSKGIPLPISLNYHASGIRVDEQGSRVGLGWSLNAGGVITRAIKGQSDMGVDNDVYHKLANNAPLSQHDWERAEQGLDDTQPDLYVFNFMGVSGKMVFDENHQPHILSDQNFKVEIINDYGPNDMGFLITDESGVKYKFTTYEITTIPESIINAGGISTWYLTEIISPNHSQPVYTFEYGDYEMTNYSIGNEARYILTFNEFASDFADCKSVEPNDLEMVSSEGATINGKYLKKIIHNRGEVLFIEGAYRPDLNTTEPQLHKILAYSDTGVLTNDFELDYVVLNERLFLNGVMEIAPLDPNTTKSHTFEYFTEVLLPKPLKSLNIPEGYMSQDYWGYYNGKNNSTMIPEPPFSMEGYNILPGDLDFGDRWPSFPESQAGMLTKINYPTGGSTTLEYEPHTYLDDNLEADEEGKKGYGIAQNYIPADQYGPWQTVTAHRTGGDLQWGYEEKDVVIATISKAIITKNVSESNCNESEPCAAHVTSPWDNDWNFLGDNVTIEKILGPGTYTISALAEQPQGCYDCNAFISVQYAEILDPEPIPTNYMTGGVRVKTIRNFDGAQEMLTRYDYSSTDENGNNSGLSSGILVSKPDYSYVFKNNLVKNTNPNAQGIPWWNEVKCGWMVLTSWSTIPMTTTQGSIMGYKTVSISKGTNDGVGKQVNHYYVESLGAYRYPYISPAYVERNGELAWSEVFRKNENGFELLQKKTNIYALDTKFTFPGVKAVYAKQSSQEFGDFPSEFKTGTAQNMVQWYRLAKTISENYEYPEGVQQLMTSEQEMEYNSLHHNFPTKIKSSNSKEEDVFAMTEYPGDLNPTSCYPDVKVLKEEYYQGIQACKDQYQQNLDGDLCGQNKIVCENTAQLCLTIGGQEVCKLPLYGSGAQWWPSDFGFSEWPSPGFAYLYVGTVYLEKIDLNGGTETIVRHKDCDELYVKCKEGFLDDYMGCLSQTKLAYDTGVANYFTCLENELANPNLQEPDKALLEMLKRNMLNVPVEQVTTLIGEDTIEKLTSASRTEFARELGTEIDMVLPKTKQATELTVPIAKMDFDADPDMYYNDQLIFDVYDLEGNMLKAHKVNDEPVIYQWGYGDKVPVAKVSGATDPDEIFTTSFEENNQAGSVFKDGEGVNLAVSGTKVLDQASFLFPAEYIPGPNTVMTYHYWDGSQWHFSGEVPFNDTIGGPGILKIDEVRAYPKGAVIETIAYDNAYRIRSMTDANNQTTYYEYDTFGRLLLVRDFDGNILSTNKYYYKGQ